MGQKIHVKSSWKLFLYFFDHTIFSEWIWIQFWYTDILMFNSILIVWKGSSHKISFVFFLKIQFMTRISKIISSLCNILRTNQNEVKSTEKIHWKHSFQNEIFLYTHSLASNLYILRYKVIYSIRSVNIFFESIEINNPQTINYELRSNSDYCINTIKFQPWTRSPHPQLHGPFARNTLSLPSTLPQSSAQFM